EIAMQAKVPIRIRSTYSDDFGTLITASRTKDIGVDIPDRLVTGIAHIAEITQLKITIDQKDAKAQSVIFTAMADAGISVDFINISPTEITYTIPNKIANHAVDLLKQLGYSATMTKDCAKVSAVGAGMTG